MKATKKGQAAGKAPGHAVRPSANAAAASQSKAMAGGNSDKVNKDMLLKKLAMCQKTYDYKDESKDVKAKTDRLNAIQELQGMLQD